MIRPFVDSKNTTEDNTHCFSGEASVVGLLPGQWPLYLTTNLGNGCDLYRCESLWDEQGFIYKQNFGCITLTLFND